MDETWIHHFPRQSAERTEAGQSRLKGSKTQTSAPRFWPPDFAMHKVVCSLITLRKLV